MTMSYDTLMTMGRAHRCPDCGGTWYDCEGGCGCGKCKECGQVMNAEELGDSGICEECEDAE